MDKCPCKNCRRLFEISPQRPDQTYCKRKICQRARKNAWQKKKIRTDEDYRQNKQDAQERWLKKNPDYYKSYREKNPEHTEKNRLAQAERNRKKRSVSNHTCIYNSIAKMDVSNDQNSIKSGRYTIISVDNPEFAKMDVIIVDMPIKSENYEETSA
ncbi:MAG: hypothetical protein QNK40_01645 [Desulfobacterales bacterium]|nr:hypothetical protein [Desulfobacterales bacterium]